MMSIEPACSHCGPRGKAETLGLLEGQQWCRCAGCGGMWVAPPKKDAFPVIARNPEVAKRPQPQRCPPEGNHRARRFEHPLVLRYRTPGSREWQDGLTENISRSGLLFRAQCSEMTDPTPHVPAAGVSLEMVLRLPGGSDDSESEIEIRCDGEVVRTQDTEATDRRPGIAVAVRGYQLSARPPG